MSRFFAKVKVLPKLQSSSTWVSSATGSDFRLMLKFLSRARATGGNCDQWRKNLCNFSIFCNEAMFNFDFTANGMNHWPGDAALFRVSCEIWIVVKLISWQHSPPTHSFTRYRWIEGYHRLQPGLCLVRQLLAPPALHWCLSGPFLFGGDC